MLFLVPIVLCLALSFAYTPDDFAKRRGMVRIAPQCSYRQVTGRPCLTCGMSRAFSAISHCNLARGLAYNRASLACYASFVLVAILLSVSYVNYLLTRHPSGRTQ